MAALTPSHSATSNDLYSETGAGVWALWHSGKYVMTLMVNSSTACSANYCVVATLLAHSHLDTEWVQTQSLWSFQLPFWLLQVVAVVRLRGAIPGWIILTLESVSLWGSPVLGHSSQIPFKIPVQESQALRNKNMTDEKRLQRNRKKILSGTFNGIYFLLLEWHVPYLQFALGLPNSVASSGSWICCAPSALSLNHLISFSGLSPMLLAWCPRSVFFHLFQPRLWVTNTFYITTLILSM